MISLYIKPQKLEVPSSPDTTNFIANMSKIERALKRNNHLQDVQINYENALHTYATEHNFSSYPPTIFSFPHNYFLYYNKSVHFVFNKAFPLFKNVPDTFRTLFHLPCTPDAQIETHLLRTLSSLLMSCKSLPKYQVLLMQYEETHKQTFPISNFFLFEDTLCLQESSLQSTVCTALNNTFFQSELNDEYKKIYTSWLPILKAIKKNTILPSFTYSKPENPYYMTMKMANYSISVKYDKESRHFHSYDCLYPSPENFVSLINTSRTNPFSLKDCDISCFFYYVNHSRKLLKDLSVSDILARFLFALTNGNYQNLINLSILAANIASPEILTPKLFLITTNSTTTDTTDISASEYFNGVLDMIFNPEVNLLFWHSFPSINKLVEKKCIPDMVNHFFSGTKLLVIDKGTSSLSDIQLKSLHKLIKGSEIKAVDKKFGTVSFRNFAPVICYSNNHKEIAYLEQNLPCIKINFDFIQDPHTIPTPLPDEYPMVFEWLRTCLPLYGMHLLAEKKFYRQPLPKQKRIKPAFSTDNITNDFLHTCCTNATDGFIYTDELYNAYTCYYESIHKSTPLKRTQFVSVLKRIPGLIYKRPHVSRSESNKYAFMGITLKPDWKKYIPLSDEFLSLDEQAFKDKLEEITKLTAHISV